MSESHQTHEWRIHTLEQDRCGDRLTAIETEMTGIRTIPGKLDAIKLWLIGLMGGLVVALLLLVLDLATGHKTSIPHP